MSRFVDDWLAHVLAETRPPLSQHWSGPTPGVNEFSPEFLEALAARGYEFVPEDRPQYVGGFRLEAIADRRKPQ